ncbi:MAG TPA: alcohol dehydrogenase [Hyphomicrobiales bacterium]|nr:alcohol dehydrogenase [Hyphomicrobiales bacterium]
MKSFCVTAFGEPLTLIEQPTPAPQGTEVLLRVKAAGVCHSDLHLQDGGYDLGQGRVLKLSDRGISLPLTMGHEVVGEVVALGPEAEGVAPGDVRLVFPWIGCGCCPACLRGTENLCATPNCIGVHRAGGYADHIIVPNAKYLVEIAPLTPDQAAPFACSGLTAYGALKKLGTLLNQHPVAIIGVGGVGLMAVSLVRALGGAGAIAVDISESKRQAALKAGAIKVIDGSSADAVAQLSAAAPEGLLAVIDFVGSPQTAKLGIGAMARGGKYVVVGLYGGELSYPLPFFPMRALTVQGSYTGSLDELKELMTLARRGAIADFPLRAHSLTEVNDVLSNLRAGTIVGRSVLNP